MVTHKQIIKKTVSTVFLFIKIILSLIIISIVAIITFFLMVEKSNQPYDNQFIQGCISAGLSEQSCKNRLY